METVVSQKAFAKVNISLYLGAKLSNGYHEIDTIMQSIELYDTLELSISKLHSFIIEGRYSNISSGEDNLVSKALKILKDHAGIENHHAIKLTKNIPFGAGLAGGSSNAFATIKAFEKLYGISFSKDEILNFARILGSDVSFFYYQGTVRATGTGEKLEPLKALEDMYVLIVKPDFTISTPKAYALWDKSPKLTSKRDLFHNDFEAALFPVYPILKEIKERLYYCKADQTLLTGSGSCVCGYFKDIKNAQKAIKDQKLLSFGDLILTKTLRAENCC